MGKMQIGTAEWIVALLAVIAIGLWRWRLFMALLNQKVFRKDRPPGGTE